MKCPECEGSGRVSVPFLFFFSRQRPCTWCHGYGLRDDPSADPEPKLTPDSGDGKTSKPLVGFDDDRLIFGPGPQVHHDRSGHDFAGHDDGDSDD